MSPATAACARCGHVFTDEEALDACPACGSTERTLRRDALALAQDEAGRPVEVRRVERRRPDGSTDLCEEPVEGFGGDPPSAPSPG